MPVFVGSPSTSAWWKRDGEGKRHSNWVGMWILWNTACCATSSFSGSTGPIRLKRDVRKKGHDHGLLHLLETRAKNPDLAPGPFRGPLFIPLSIEESEFCEGNAAFWG